MRVPAIAKKTFDELCSRPEFLVITQLVLEELSKISSPLLRAKFIHKTVDELNEEVFSHPLVKDLSPCGVGCSACCHTQVSVTAEEALLLTQKIVNGITIDPVLLMKQAATGDESDKDFKKLSYEDKKCVFLDEKGSCRVYDDRPSVCRTNSVLGDASQCVPTESPQRLRLVKTQQADMAIYASFLFSEDAGSMSVMLQKYLEEFERLKQEEV